MAEKSKVKWKKWVIALAVLVAIAIIVVAVVFSIPKDINKVKQAVASHQETTFLTDDEEIELFDSFIAKIDPAETDYIAQAQNTKVVAGVVDDIMTFYNQFMFLTQNSSTFQSQYNNILNALSQSDNNKANLGNILRQVEGEVSASSPYAKTAWERFKTEFESYVKNYTSAFEGLALVIRDSFPQGTMNNPLLFKTLQTANDFLIVVQEDHFQSKDIARSAKTFVNAYLFKDNSEMANSRIYRYQYSEDLQNSLQKIEQFSTVYKDKTLKDVIKTAKDNNFSFQSVEGDTDNVLAEVKTYLRGSLAL